MRSSELKGIINDLLHLEEDFNPIVRAFIQDKLEINLITGKINYPEKDDVFKFYEEKAKWFKNRILFLKGKLSDFDEAKINVFGHEEKLILKYHGKVYEGRVVLNKKDPSDYGSYVLEDWFNWKDDD